MHRTSFGLDVNRPDAVEKRRRLNQRTACANVEEICNPGSFIEYGALAIAAIADEEKRSALYEKLVAALYQQGKALNGDHAFVDPW